MTLFATSQQRAALLILLLGAGLVMALAPYLSGLIGGLVLFVIFAPLHDLLLGGRRLLRGPAGGSATARRVDRVLRLRPR